MSKLNKTVVRALSILQILKDSDSPLTASQISEKLEAPRSSTFDILATLLACDFIYMDDSRLKTYALGIRSFEVGAAYLKRTELVPTVNPYLKHLMKQTGGTAFLAIENKGKLVYLDKVEAPTSIRTTAFLGSSSDMYCTGLGKALLASFNEKQADAIIEDTAFIPYTPYTITSKKELLRELENTRKRGYAIDNRETDEIQYCLAAPILDSKGNATAAVSVALMFPKLNEQLKQNYALELTDCAIKISRKLGYLGDTLYG